MLHNMKPLDIASIKKPKKNQKLNEHKNPKTAVLSWNQNPNDCSLLEREKMCWLMNIY